MYRFLKKIQVPTTGKLELKVRRDHIVEDSLDQISRITETEKLRKTLWIEFMGEAGEDYGGVTRDWFFHLSKELFNPYLGLFEYSANDVYTLQINPDSGLLFHDQHHNHLEIFHFIGRLVGMALYHKNLINAFFIRPFYTMMLGKILQKTYAKLILMKMSVGKKLTLEDMQYVDEIYFNSLKDIRKNDPSDYGLTFQASYTSSLGITVYEDLVENGQNIPVNEKNKAEYIDKVVQWRFVKRVKV